MPLGGEVSMSEVVKPFRQITLARDFQKEEKKMNATKRG